MTSLSQAKDMFRMQRDAKKVRKQLKKVHVEAEAEGVRVVVNGEQEIVSIDIAEDVPRASIPSLLTDALNRAMKKAQVVAAEQMQGVLGDMGMPTEEGMRGLGQ
jgi:DNA-binding protein YbaB